MLQVNDHRLLKKIPPLHRPRDYRRYVFPWCCWRGCTADSQTDWGDRLNITVINNLRANG